jgi:hypothetical protein
LGVIAHFADHATIPGTKMQIQYHLAQVNIAKAIAPLDSPVMQGFVDQLDHINQLADNSEGFVWRLQTEEGDATALQPFDDPLTIMNLSVWSSLESLKNYAYSGDHLSIMKQKKSWFEKSSEATLALWWLPVGELPTPESARAMLEKLRREGPSQEVFTFAKPFLMPETREASEI